MTPSTVPSIKIVKSFAYRGGTQLWSNRYHFTAASPTTAGRWTALSDAIVLAEKACLTQRCTIVEAVGYDAGSDVPAHFKAYTTVGTFSDGGASLVPGDSAALIRYATAGRSSKNHPIYLYNYVHSVVAQAYPNQDTLMSTHVTALGTYAAAWIAGFSDGTVTHARCGPQGDVALGYVVKTTITHRDFPSG